MDDTITSDTVEDVADVDDPTTEADDGVDEELLIEEVSIDGMCGVY